MSIHDKCVERIKARITIDGMRYIPIDQYTDALDVSQTLRDINEALRQQLADARLEIVAGRSVREELEAEVAHLKEVAEFWRSQDEIHTGIISDLQSKNFVLNAKIKSGGGK